MVVPEFQKYKNKFLECINRCLDFPSLCTIEFITHNNYVVP